jgi:CRP-like cAMP-binding protein
MTIDHWTATTPRQPAERERERRPEWLRQLPSSLHELSAGASRELGDERELIYVVEGRLLVSAVDEKGDEIVSILRGAGTLIGLERLHDIVVPYQLWALSDVQLENFAIEPMKRWIADRLEEPAKSLVKSALEAAGSAVRERTTLHGRVLTRVAKFLVDATVGDSALRLPRFVMARILSMRPETLSRALKELEVRGAIALRPRLKVVQQDALRQIITAH